MIQHITNLWHKFLSLFRRRSYTQAVLDEKPVAFYKLDGTFEDSSGHGYHAVLRREEVQ